MEVDGNNAIKEVIEQNLTVFIDGLNIEEILEPCAEFVTERESWMMDGKFKVEHSKEEEEREKLKQEIDYDIKAFM
jgi:hypothetical protein